MAAAAARPAARARPPALRSQTSSAGRRPQVPPIRQRAAQPSSGPRTGGRTQQGTSRSRRVSTAAPQPAARPGPRTGPSGLARSKRASTAAAGQAGRGTATVQAGFSQGGQHALAAELLLFFVIVGIRAVATYGPGDKKDLPADQFGPLFILGNGLAAFFVLAFLAARGGNWAKVAAVAGLAIDLALLMKSIPHLDSIAREYGEPRKYVPESLAGSYQTGQASVLPPALAYENATGQLPPAPKGKSAAAAMRYAHRLLKHYDLSPAQWPNLVRLWNRESGWNYRATNPNSGAYGIPQALPADKLAAAGKDWKTDPATQVRWGLQYIHNRYGSINSAWAHELHFGWY